MYFWKQVTASEWDAKFKDLVRKLLVDNPQFRWFGERLDDHKQALMRRDAAIDQFPTRLLTGFFRFSPAGRL